MAIKKTDKSPAKKTVTRAATKAATKTVQPVKKATPTTVVARTTKPKVVIQTKKLTEQLPVSHFSTNEPCGQKCHNHEGKWVLKVILLLILLVNLGLMYCIYQIVHEQQQFVISSNGGKENYNMLKDIYSTPQFQQASTLSVYQLIERVEQSLNSAAQPAEAQPQYDQYDQYDQ